MEKGERVGDGALIATQPAPARRSRDKLLPLELWAGAECTVNRVGDRFACQLVQTGHHERHGDIDLLASLGVSAVRFPILWERVSPDVPHERDWSWSDSRLRRLREHGIRPIAGLVHHGSGPRYTSLLDNDFATGLARHAEATARRYDWIEDWTPVNEPLTTGRFSALYGHWYPHHRDERLFWRALLNQTDATRLSMNAVRAIIPHARLIQTDDLGRTYATAPLHDQAGFENVRRWSTWDLLCGRFSQDHPFWERLCSYGLRDRLLAIADDPCPPDVLGINHYLTSDRFLDHRVARYPERVRGGNGRRDYADVEAVRVLQPGPQGLRGAIDEAWDRYNIPIAITEVHNGCTREEQLRWTREAWETAQQARSRGIDLVAVTAWAVFGNVGWNTLLTGPGEYESGVYDVRGGTPRETALAKLLRSFRDSTIAPPPAAAGAGWWNRDIRFHYPVVRRAGPAAEQVTDGHAPPILITGATGTLGGALAAACRHRNLPYVLTSRQQLDLHDARSIEAALDDYRPCAVINASGWVRVDDAEDDPSGCLRANAEGAASLARACDRRDLPSIAFSSDLVFDGVKESDYLESDTPAPLGVYGDSKARMEEAILGLSGRHLIVRTSAFFSPFDEHNFAIHAIRALRGGERFHAAEDQIVTATYVPDLCNAVLDLLIDEQCGIWHLSNAEALSWADLARRVAQRCGYEPSHVAGASGQKLGWRAPRPARCGLASERGVLLPSLDSALQRFAEHMAAPAPAR